MYITAPITGPTMNRFSVLILLLLLSAFTSLAQKKKDHDLDGCLEGCWEVSFIVVPELKKSIQFIKGAELITKFKEISDSGVYVINDRAHVFEVMLNKYDVYLVEVIDYVSYPFFYGTIKGHGALLVVCLWEGDEVNRSKAKRVYREVMKEYRRHRDH